MRYCAAVYCCLESLNFCEYVKVTRRRFEYHIGVAGLASEYLLEQVDELQTKTYLQLPAQQSYIAAPFDTPPKRGLAVPLPNSVDALRAWLREKVFDHYRYVEDNTKLAYLAVVLNPLRPTSSPLVVFTVLVQPEMEKAFIR